MTQARPPLVLANHGDFIGQCMDARFHADELKIWYSGSAALLDHALFWATGDALAVVTDDVHPELLADARAFSAPRRLRRSGQVATDSISASASAGTRMRVPG